MSKEAILFILDVGPSMWQRPLHDQPPFTSFLEQAILAVSRLIRQKIIDDRKTDLVSLVLFGTDETKSAFGEEYPNVFVAQEFSPASLTLLTFVGRDLPMGRKGGDPLDALIVGVDLMSNATLNKKFTRKIFLFTDASSRIDSHGIDIIADKLKQLEASLDIIGFDFDDVDNEDGFKQDNKPEVKMKNEAILYNLARTTGGSLFAIDEALDLLTKFVSKRVRKSTMYRGLLTLGATDPSAALLSFPVIVYSKTQKSTVPSAKKIHVDTTNDNFSRGDDAVERIVSYFKAGDEEKIDEIMESAKVRAHRYGNAVVPFHEVPEDSLRVSTSKSLSIIGFVPCSKIPRDAWMGQISLVALDTENSGPKDAELFSALLHAIFEKDTGILVRYVRCANANPKLGFIIPCIKSKAEYAYMTWLPFSEDVRHYTFATLDVVRRFKILNKNLPLSLEEELSNEQLQAKINSDMDAWIDSLDLVNVPSCQGEAYHPKKTFNIALQHLYDCIESRLFGYDRLPPVDVRLVAQMEPLPQLSEEARGRLDVVLACLPLVPAGVAEEHDKTIENIFYENLGSKSPSDD